MKFGRLNPLSGLPLLAKMLIPFVALTMVVGVLGVTFVTRDLARRAEDSLGDDLARRIVEARSFVHERELYALESGNYAANLQGMAGAITARDRNATSRILGSVLALKGELALAVATGIDGVAIVELRPSGASPPVVTAGGHWREIAFVDEAARSPEGTRFAGALAGAAVPMIAVAAPVCSGSETCRAVGITIVGLPAASLLPAGAEGEAEEGRALFDRQGALLASRGIAVPPPPGLQADPVRRSFRTRGERHDVLYAPFTMGGRPAGTVAIAVPTAPALAAARAATRRLVVTLAAILAAMMLMATVLVRTIIKNVRAVVATNRRLGAGELTARANVSSRDEIGELAAGVNSMADQLQAAVETLELRVEQRTEEIRRLLHERTQFYASLSHEFRTPLAVIIAQADRLGDKKAARNGRRTEEITTTIRSSAGQALEIVNDVLTAARAQAGRVELRPEPLDLAAMLGELAPTIEGLAAGARIAVEIDASARLPAVAGDPTRLREILLNLADNAVKYTPPGGRLRIAAERSGEFVSISVADSGPGIPDGTGARVFEPFYRVPGSEPLHGRSSSGLGLALTRRLVEAHGGIISYECPPGGGTVFTFTMPVA